MKPFSRTAEENRTVVFPVIQAYVQDVSQALEIASGTGQEIIYFAEKTPNVGWQPTDLSHNIPGIRQWVGEANLHNVLPPKVLDVASTKWPVVQVEFAYTSNSLHIMSWQHVKALFSRLGELMISGTYFCVYGPFSFSGQHVSESNLRFDAYLKQRDPNSGIRDTQDLKILGEQHGFVMHKCVEMPHNNHILVWHKQ